MPFLYLKYKANNENREKNSSSFIRIVAVKTEALLSDETKLLNPNNNYFKMCQDAPKLLSKMNIHKIKKVFFQNQN